MEQGVSSAVNTETIRQALEALLSSAVGSVVYDQLSRLVAEWMDLETEAGHSYRNLATLLLEDIARDNSSEHVMSMVGRLVQARHQAHLPVVSTNRPVSLAELAARLSSDDRMFRALQRLNDALSGAAPNTIDQPPKASETVTTPVAAPARPDTAPRPRTSPPANAEHRVDHAYRQHLDRQRDEIIKLQATLADKIQEANSRNKEFGDLLRIERNALQQAENVREVTALRKILLGGVDELLNGQQALAENLSSTSDMLHLIESDSARLHDELDKVRQLSMTDESTGLPNRRAFLRRLEDEISRAERYGLPLTIAILDLDEFKQINDTFGHATGDCVLREFADKALSIFRHHDMVARFGGEEFSVLLPSTTLDGAMAALRKVQARAKALDCTYDQRTVKLPTFSCGLALYKSGESTNLLLERADRALYRAKNQGRNRIEVELPASLIRSSPSSGKPAPNTPSS